MFAIQKVIRLELGSPASFDPGFVRLVVTSDLIHVLIKLIGMLCGQLVIVVENLDNACLLSDLRLAAMHTLGNQQMPKLAAVVHARSFAC